MAICAFEIGAATLIRRVNIPAATAFVGNQGPVVCLGDACCERGIFLDGAETVVDCER